MARIDLTSNVILGCGPWGYSFNSYRKQNVIHLLLHTKVTHCYLSVIASILDWLAHQILQVEEPRLLHGIHPPNLEQSPLLKCEKTDAMRVCSQTYLTVKKNPLNTAAQNYGIYLLFLSKSDQN